MFTKKLKLESNKKLLNIHCPSFQYIHIYNDHFFPTTLKLQYASIVRKIKNDDNTNKDFRLIGLFIQIL